MTPHPSSLAPLKLIPLVSVNEYQLLLGRRRRRQRQVWCIPIADERVGVQVKLWDPLRTLAIPWALLRWCFTKRRYIKCTYLYLTYHLAVFWFVNRMCWWRWLARRDSSVCGRDSLHTTPVSDPTRFWPSSSSSRWMLRTTSTCWRMSRGRALCRATLRFPTHSHTLIGGFRCIAATLDLVDRLMLQ